MTARPTVSAQVALDALLTSDGQRLLAELSCESLDDELRLITRFRACYNADLVSAGLAQVKLRRRARAKFDRADAMYFTAPGLEQASTERMARHHAERFTAFERVADLCSGIGGDLIGLAAIAPTLAVDIDPEHSRMGVLNAAAYGIASQVDPVCADVRSVDLSRISAAFIDPARRSGERRFRSGESEPPLEWCFALAEKGTAVGIKAAPGLPLDVVPSGWEIEFVSERGELKESLLWSPSMASAAQRATVLPGGETLVAVGQAALAVREPGSYLLDPDPAVTRAGLVAELGARLGDVWQIDERIAFISGEVPVPTPFGRWLRIEASMPWSLARVRESLRSLDVGTVDIRKRGSAVDVEEIQRRLKLTGRRAATLVLTRVRDRPWAMVGFGIST
jgi:hypothetical protein